MSWKLCPKRLLSSSLAGGNEQHGAGTGASSNLMVKSKGGMVRREEEAVFGKVLLPNSESEERQSCRKQK